MRDKYEIAEAIRNADEWDPDDCRELCELAGLSEEWRRPTARPSNRSFTRQPRSSALMCKNDSDH